MQVTLEEISRTLTLLEETPQRIAVLTSGLENARLSGKPDQESWAIQDILAHLRSCADVWGKSMLAMITQDHPTLRYVSPRTWIRKTNYPELEFHRSLDEFTRQRDDLLRMLKPLDIEGWARGATFMGTTRGREQTVYSYAERMAVHEVQHLDQIMARLHL